MSFICFPAYLGTYPASTTSPDPVNVPAPMTSKAGRSLTGIVGSVTVSATPAMRFPTARMTRSDGRSPRNGQASRTVNGVCSWNDRHYTGLPVCEPGVNQSEIQTAHAVKVLEIIEKCMPESAAQ